MTTTAQLTGQERVSRCLARADHDRIPRYETFWPETIRRWQTEDLEGDGETVLELMEADLHGHDWYWPSPFPGSYETLEEDADTKVTRTPLGAVIREWKNRSVTPEHLSFECEDPDIWAEKYLPAYRGQGVVIDVEAQMQAYREGRAAGRWCFLRGVEPFEVMRAMLGDENFMCAMLEEPAWIAEIAEVVISNAIVNYSAVLAAGAEPDGLWCYGDMAFNKGTFCSPEAYRKLIWPQHKRLVDWTHEHGMKFIYHTDGDVRGVLDLYVEAGFDCIQPMESKANMDIRELAPHYGKDMAFFGNIDIMKYAFAGLDEIEEEIRTKFAAGMANHGYLYHSDHSVPPQVSWQKYQAILKLVERYGQYA